MSIAQTVKAFKCTPEQAAAQFLANAKQLQAMAERAKATGKKVGGYTVQELEERVAKLLAVK